MRRNFPSRQVQQLAISLRLELSSVRKDRYLKKMKLKTIPRDSVFLKWIPSSDPVFTFYHLELDQSMKDSRNVILKFSFRQIYGMDPW